MEIFVHTASREDPELHTIESDSPVRSLQGAEPDALIWLGDADEPVDLGLTLAQAGIGHNAHLHRGRCRRVDVTVRFNASAFEADFGPGAPVRRVYEWASGPDGANLSPEQAAKHVLAVPGADHFLADSVHIGSLVASGSCGITLDLLPKERFEG
jgi:hypothetical protein